MKNQLLIANFVILALAGNIHVFIQAYYRCLLTSKMKSKKEESQASVISKVEQFAQLSNLMSAFDQSNLFKY